ncbi:MAG TPA: nucleotidyltransferase domain-containing protein [Flavobacteriaceae bacterium]|nr:nucleotidyltransferase domain-containing protein [Flavobacteriaceae bacterium]
MVNQGIIEIIRKYLSLLPENLEVKKAYLFGSFAKGKEHEGSDIDIALIFNDLTDFFSTQRQLRKLRRSIDLRIEPHPIAQKDFNSMNPFAQEIKRNGMEITL